MAGAQQLPEQYTVPQLARVFHNLPHFNIYFRSVNNTFNPHSKIYLESLGILGSFPAAWLILTLLVLLIYLVTRCCDRKPRPRRSITLLKCLLAILALFCCGAVAVGLYGNDDMHNGLEKFFTACKKINEIFLTMKNQTGLLENEVTKTHNLSLSFWDAVENVRVSNQTLSLSLLATKDSMIENINDASNYILKFQRIFTGISFTNAIEIGEKFEQLRWPITIAVLSALLVLCVILLVGVARHSRCVLITFSVFGLFAVIISWLMTSLYLASSVALGDFCVSPDGYLTTRISGSSNSEFFSYYIHCDNARSNPFNYTLREGQRTIFILRQNLNNISELTNQLFPGQKFQPNVQDITKMIENIHNLLSSLLRFADCSHLHRHYVDAAKSLCHLGLYGLSLMLLASLAAGLFFTVMVWVDSHTWIYIRKRRDYNQVTEQDHYLPPSAASQAIAARTLRGQGSYPPTAPTLIENAHGTHNIIKQPLLLTPPPPSYATATARARQLHESMLKGGGINGSGGSGNHKSSQHNQQSSSGRAEHRSGYGDQPGQYATLSKQCKTLESNDFY